MKKFFRLLYILILILPFAIKAEENFVLPNPGLTPNNPIYFMDLLGEKVQEWLTFNSVTKAKLNANFVTERVAEVQEMLKNREVDANGLNTALDNLKKNSADVSAWLDKSNKKNINIDNIAVDLNNKLSASIKKLDEILITSVQSFATWRSDLQLLLTQASQNDQFKMADDFKKQLEKVDNQITLISSKISGTKVADSANSESKENTLEKPIIIKPSSPSASNRVKTDTDFNVSKIKAEATLQGIRQLKSQIDDLANESGVEIDEETFENYNLFYPQIKKNIADGDYAQAEQTAANLREHLLELEQEIKDYLAGG